MTYILCASLIVTVFAFVWLIDRKDRRHATQIQDLCQRVQAPEVAVMQYADLPPDQDEQPMTDEQLAEQEERARAIAFLERHENGGEQWPH